MIARVLSVQRGDELAGSGRDVSLESTLAQAIRRAGDRVVDYGKRLIASRAMVDEYQVEVNRQARHVAHEQVDRRAALEREQAVGED